MSDEDATRAFCLQQDGTGNHLSIIYVDETLVNGQVEFGRLVEQGEDRGPLPLDGQTTRITVFSPNRNSQLGMWSDPKGVAAAQLFRLAKEAQAERASLANEASRAADERNQAASERRQLADEAAQASIERSQAAAERADLHSRINNASDAFNQASAERAQIQAQLDAANAEITRASAERASLQAQVAAATAAADAASQQAAHVISATTSHRIELEQRMESVERTSRAQSRAASPDASNPAIARAQAAADHARQQSETASPRLSEIEKASASARSRLEALECLPTRMDEMHHALMELSATMGTMSRTLGARGTATNPIDVSSSSASFQQQPSSFQQQPSSFQQVPVSFVSSASTNDPSTIMLQHLCETGSEVVGTASAPHGVLDPFLPKSTIAAISTLPHHYRWARKSAMGEKLRTALADMAHWITGPGESAASASLPDPRARAEKWLRESHVRLSTSEWLVFREGDLQCALELAVSKKRNNPDLFALLLASRHPTTGVTTLNDYASGSALLNGDELWAGNKAKADKAKADKAEQARADRAAAADPASGKGKGGKGRRSIS